MGCALSTRSFTLLLPFTRSRPTLLILKVLHSLLKLEAVLSTHEHLLTQLLHLGLSLGHFVDRRRLAWHWAENSLRTATFTSRGTPRKHFALKERLGRVYACIEFLEVRVSVETTLEEVVLKLNG